MTDLRTTLVPDGVALDVDAAVFPRDAVYGAAFAFIDRCYVRLDQAGAGRLAVLLRPKAAGSIDGEALAAEVHAELLAQSFRVRLAEGGRDLTDAIVAGAFGAAGAAPIDDLMSDEGIALDDPLGIALQWEEKHAKKAAPPEPAVPAPAVEGVPRP